MKRYRLVIFLLCLPNWLYANEALDNFLGGLQTLSGKFEQNIYDENGFLLEQSRGRMYIQRPNKFRWIYQKPYYQLIVADGKKVWIYDKDLEQVTVKTLDNTLGKTPAFLLSRHRKVEKDFVVNQLASKDGGITHLELVPKKETKTQFEKMRINLHNNTLVSFEFLDSLGQTTHINFTKLKRNRKIRDKVFRFVPPAGVDIIN
jgi:outer membrane lipoprotein carrier protein